MLRACRRRSTESVSPRCARRRTRTGSRRRCAATGRCCKRAAAAEPAFASALPWDAPRMTRRRALWIVGIAMLALFAVELVFDGRMQDAGGYGIVDFEVAFTSGKAQEIMRAWGRDGHDAAIASL